MLKSKFKKFSKIRNSNHNRKTYEPTIILKTLNCIPFWFYKNLSLHQNSIVLQKVGKDGFNSNLFTDQSKIIELTTMTLKKENLTQLTYQISLHFNQAVSSFNLFTRKRCSSLFLIRLVIHIYIDHGYFHKIYAKHYSKQFFFQHYRRVWQQRTKFLSGKSYACKRTRFFYKF